MQNTPRNGQQAPSPAFAVIGQAQFVILPYLQVLASLETNAVEQSKTNLAFGPLFHKIADDFRAWSKIAEPGCMLSAPEIKLCIIRLACCAPLAQSFSEAAEKQLRAAAEQPDTPRIERA
jgi:hypothetical protein